MRIILASKSPRRKEILATFGVKFDVIGADTDESSDTTDPAALVQELSLRKAHAVRDLLKARNDWDDDTLIIASDTVVSCNNSILGKPRDNEDAARMLRLLSDNTHHVLSGIALICGGRETVGFDSTAVRFAPMSEENIAWYIKTGEPADKAGAYAVQGLASLWIRGIHGDYFTVVGLPVFRLNTMLSDFLGQTLPSLPAEAR